MTETATMLGKNIMTVVEDRKNMKPLPKSKKVAIVGYTPTKDLAPYKDTENFQIWGMNDLYKYIPRYDRWFQIHTPEEIQRTHLQAPNDRDSWEVHKQALAKMIYPVYMQNKFTEIPYSVVYPLDEITEHFGVVFTNSEEVKYFTNSVSFMMALAIYEGFEEIHVYGVDMATTVGNEYGQQRPSCEFWLGVAAGRGIKLYIPKEADLLKTRFLYGYEDENKHAFESKVSQMLQNVQAKKAQAAQQHTHWNNHEMQYIGAEMAINEIMMAWQ